MIKSLLRLFPRLLVLALCLAAFSGCKARRVKNLLADAQRDFNAKRYDAAELEYRKALHQGGINAIAIANLGLIYSDEGRMQAGWFLKKALELDPKNAQVRLKMGALYAAGGRAQDAINLIEPVLLDDPANDEGLMLLVQLTSVKDLPALRHRMETQTRTGGEGIAPCYTALGWIDVKEQKLDEAEADFQKAISLNPKLSSPHFGLATVCSLHKDVKGLEDNLKIAADLSPIRSSIRLRYVDIKIRAGDRDQAKQILLDMTREAPDYLPAWLELMRLTFGERKFDECKNANDTVLARDPENYDALVASSDLALAQNDAPQAVAILQRMSDLAPYKNSPVVRYKLALAHLSNRENSKAMGRLNDALTLSPNYLPATILLSELDIRSGNPRNAITLLTPVIKNDPSNGRAYALIAQAHLSLQERQQAIEIFRQMALKFPGEPLPPFQMGMVFQQEGDLTQAHASYEKALQVDPGYMPALGQITALDLQQKHFTEAQTRIDGALEKDPKQPGIVMLQSQIFLAEGNTNKAVDALNKVIELKPDASGPSLTLASIYLASHKEAEALQRLNALVSKTHDITAMLEIGEIQQFAHHYDLARDAYEKLLAVNSNCVPALNNLAVIYDEQFGQPEKAIKLAEQARNLQPDDAGTADTLGWLLYKQHDYIRALTLLQESADKQPGEPEVQMHLGMTYYMLQAESPARQALEFALASQKDFRLKDTAGRFLTNLNINPATASPQTVSDLEKQLLQDPHDPIVLVRLAAIQEHAGNFEKAVGYYQSLVDNNSQDVNAKIQLARLYFHGRKDTRKALELATDAHKMAPDNPQASMLLGEMMYRNGDYPWAVSLLEQAATQLGNLPELQYHLAWSYYSVGRVADADAAMQQTIRLDPAFSEINQARQFLALRAAITNSSQSAASAALVQGILDKDPTNVPALMVSASQAESRGSYKDAMQTCNKVLDIFPLFAPAMRQLAILYFEHDGDQTRAYDLGMKAVASLPDDLELARVLGILAYRRSDYTSSLAWLRSSADKYSSDGELLGCLGMDYFQLNQRPQSKKVLLQALALNNIPAPLADQARRALTSLK